MMIGAVTVCGSYKFKDEIMEAYRILTEGGHIVLLPAIDCYENNKEFYMNLHKEKIRRSDYIFVVDVGGYIGESVQEEIEFALSCRIPVVKWSSSIGKER